MMVLVAPGLGESKEERREGEKRQLENTIQL
jgi:hypothetical protein